MELFRALGSLSEQPQPEHLQVAVALGLGELPPPSVYSSVVESQRFPYASVYLGPEGMMGGEARDRIADFQRALGFTEAKTQGGTKRSPQRPQEADHLASLLGLLAALGKRAAELADSPEGVLLEQARNTLLWEHILSWTPLYLMSFERCDNAFYAGWAELLSEALSSLLPPEELPDYPPVALREAPALQDPRENGAADFVKTLLAPARSGIIILRDDLVRAGTALGLVCRAGERRYTLTQMLAQDPTSTLSWLAEHASSSRSILQRREPARITSWWAARAEATATLLASLAHEAAATTSP